MAWIVEKVKEWTDPAKDLPEDAVYLDQLLTLVSVYWFAKGGVGAANFLYHTMHAAAAWGRRMTALRDSWQLGYWSQHAAGGHFPAMEAPTYWSLTCARSSRASAKG